MAIRLLDVPRYLLHRNIALPTALSVNLFTRAATISCLSKSKAHPSIRQISQYVPKKYLTGNRKQVNSYPVSVQINEKEYLDHIHASGEAYQSRRNDVPSVKKGLPNRTKYIKRNRKP